MADQTKPLTAEERAKRFADLMVKHGVRLTEPGDLKAAMKESTEVDKTTRPICHDCKRPVESPQFWPVWPPNPITVWPLCIRCSSDEREQRLTSGRLQHG